MSMRFADRLMAPSTVGLGITMTIGYGTIYYPFAIIGPEIARDFGWTDSFVFGVFSIALLASAAAAPVSGRMMDRFGPRSVLVVGSLLTALALTTFAQVGTRTSFVLAVLASECISTMVLYEAGFAALTAMHGLDARRHATQVTLFGGFASTIFWPLIQWLLGFTDWRGVLLVLAAINLLIALPIHCLLPSPRRTGGQGALRAAMSAVEPGLLAENRRSRPFLLMALAFACGGFLMSAVHTSFFLLLEAMGRSAALAATAGAILGPMQVAARLAEMLSGGRLPAAIVGLISNVAMLVGVALLVIAAGIAGPLPVILFALSFGVGQGLSFVARAVLPARLFGTGAYGRITGNLASIRLIFTAAGPFLTALCLDRFGIGAAFAMLGTMAVIGVAAACALSLVDAQAQNRVNGEANVRDQAGRPA